MKIKDLKKIKVRLAKNRIEKLTPISVMFDSTPETCLGCINNNPKNGVKMYHCILGHNNIT